MGIRRTKTLGSFEFDRPLVALLRDNDHSDPEIKPMFPKLFQPVRFKPLLHYWVLEGNPYLKVTHRRIHRTLDLFRF